MTNAHGVVGNTGMHCTQSSWCLPLLVVVVGLLQLLDSDQEGVPLGFVHMAQCLRKSQYDLADGVPGDTPPLLALVHYMMQLHIDVYIYIYMCTG